MHVFGPTSTGRIRTYTLSLVSVCLSLCLRAPVFLQNPHWNCLIFCSYMDTRQNCSKWIFYKNSYSPLIPFNPLKMTKEWGFSTFLQIGTSELSNFWSLDQLVVETLGVAFFRSYVRSYVRTHATLFLGNCSFLFF